jgi:chromosome segregation ATPase
MADHAVHQAGYVAQPPGPPQPTGAGYLQGAPVFRGAELPPLYPPTATEHAVELRRTIDQLAAENEKLREQINALEEKGAQQAELLERAEDELANARDELAAAREEISQWTSQTRELETEMRDSRQSQSAAMRGVMERLETILRVHRARPLESVEEGEGDDDEDAAEELPAAEAER